MPFDTNNKIVKLCVRGMELEGEGKPEEAHKLFKHAWTNSTSDHEKLITAHYLARHPLTIQDKLYWDEVALSFAVKVDDMVINESYPCST